jgi:hypothetical protein
MQMLVGLNSGCVVAILPECALLAFALVVFLCGATRDELHALGDDVVSRVFDQQVNVIACLDVIEDAKTEAFLRFEKPMQIASPVACKLQEKFSLMAAMRDVPEMARKKMTVSSRHPLFLETHFRRQKAASKPSKDAYYATVTREINKFPCSDPELFVS